MNDVIYTHDYKLKFGDFKMQGECEFDLDGRASFHSEEPLTNLDTEQANRITRLFIELKKVFNKFGSIKQIKISEK